MMTKQLKIVLLTGLGIIITLITLWVFRFDIANHFLSKHLIYWSDNVEVNYNDFNADVDLSSDRNIFYYHGLYLKSTILKKAHVRTVFDKKKSWVKDTTNFDFQEEMELQKIRFDLFEVYTRKFNHEIDKIRNQSGKKFSDLEKIGDSIYSELNALDDQIFDSNSSASEIKRIWGPKIYLMLSQTKK